MYCEINIIYIISHLVYLWLKYHIYKEFKLNTKGKIKSKSKINKNNNDIIFFDPKTAWDFFCSGGIQWETLTLGNTKVQLENYIKVVGRTVRKMNELILR